MIFYEVSFTLHKMHTLSIWSWKDFDNFIHLCNNNQDKGIEHSHHARNFSPAPCQSIPHQDNTYSDSEHHRCILPFKKTSRERNHVTCTLSGFFTLDVRFLWHFHKCHTSTVLVTCALLMLSSIWLRECSSPDCYMVAHSWLMVRVAISSFWLQLQWTCLVSGGHCSHSTTGSGMAGPWDAWIFELVWKGQFSSALEPSYTPSSNEWELQAPHTLASLAVASLLPLSWSFKT